MGNSASTEPPYERHVESDREPEDELGTTARQHPTEGDEVSLGDDDKPEEIEEEEEEEDHLSTNIQSMMNLLKGNIGTGILAMPDAVKNAGILFGTLGIVVVGFIAIHCMHMLIKCSQIITERTNRQGAEYEDVLYSAFEIAPPPLNRLKHIMKKAILTFLIITQMGFCCVYVLFVADNIRLFVDAFQPSYNPSVQIYMTCLLPILIPLNFIKDLKSLAPFTMFANLLVIVGLAIVLVACCQDIPPVSALPLVAHWTTIPLFFGSVVFAFEGISLVIPLQNNMRTPQAFSGLTGVLNTGMMITLILYTATGFFGYLKYGDQVKGSITLNIPTNFWLFLSVKLMFSISMCISFVLQMYIPLSIISPSLDAKFESTRNKTIANSLLRIVLVLITWTLAMVIPHLDLLISLIGALSGAALALVFPPIVEMALLWPNKLGRYRWRLVKDVLILLFGLVGFVAGTATSIVAIVHAFQTGT